MSPCLSQLGYSCQGVRPQPLCLGYSWPPQTTVGSISKLPLSHSGMHHVYSEFIKVRKGGGFGVIGMLYWAVMSSLLLIIINSLKIRLLMISTQKRGAGLSQEQNNYLLMRCKFPKEVTEMYRIHLLN